MKKLTIIYWKNRNYKGVDFMDYSLIEKGTYENLMIKNYDFMYIWETKKKTKEVFEAWLKTQIKKVEDAWFNYWQTIIELRYWKSDF